MVKFLADECTFDSTVELLRNEGWDVATVKGIGLRGAKDPEVLNKAQETAAVLVTQDLGFGDIRRFPPSAYCGVVVLKMTYRTSDEVHAVLRTSGSGPILPPCLTPSPASITETPVIVLVIIVLSPFRPLQ